MNCSALDNTAEESFRTLNLDGNFDSIKAQLDGIAERYFGIKAA